MSSESGAPVETSEPLREPAPPAAAAAAPAEPRALARTTVLLALVAFAALLSTAMLWQKLSAIQEQLARQSADTGANAIEARTLARQAQEQVRDAVARQAVLETRLNEVALQRSQLEELMQSLSLSRDENLVVDIESSLRLAQQQTELTGSPQPLLAALKTADQRLARTSQPRLTRVRSAMAHDMDRIRAAGVTDLPAVLARLDELVRQVDELPTLNAVPARALQDTVRKSTAPVVPQLWWQRWTDSVMEEVRALVRVSRIDQPEAALLSPEQAFFLRENLKLKLLNARLSLLARHVDVARSDVMLAAATLHKFFDPASRRTQAAATTLQQVQSQLRAAELPRIDETLAALSAAAGR